MKIFNTDINQLGVLLLPTFLRKPVILAFLRVLLSPVLFLFSLFSKNRDNNLYQLQITPQVCYLEKMLNDRYDPQERRIYITDGEMRDTDYLYLQSELQDEYIFLESEKKDEYYFLENEIGFSGATFIIHVPQAVSFNENEMRGLVNSYKLTTRSYDIVTF